MVGPTLETERLLLRPPVAADFEPWAAMLADPEAVRFMGGVRDRAGAWINISVMAGAWIINGFSNFSVLRKDTGQWIGTAGPWRPEGWPGPELGWALERSAWGQGYATEAATRCLHWVFDELGWREVMHLIEPENTASIAVAERLGSTWLKDALVQGSSGSRRVLVYGQGRP